MPPNTGLVKPLDLSFPQLPQGLHGLRIMHLSDMHIRPRKTDRRHETILTSVEQFEHDLLLITGDSMVGPGDETAAANQLSQIVGASRARLGAVGVWGNHDTVTLRKRLIGTGVRWLADSAWLVPELDFTLLGVNCDFGEYRGDSGDLIAALLDEAEQRTSDSPRFRMLLAHVPTWFTAASSCGIDLQLSGHTHGGQWRLPTGHALYNATPGWPLRYSSGVIRRGSTQCVISRGLGEVGVDLRIFCPPEIPLITLRKA